MLARWPWIPSLQSCENKFLLFISFPVYGHRSSSLVGLRQLLCNSVAQSWGQSTTLGWDMLGPEAKGKMSNTDLSIECWYFIYDAFGDINFVFINFALKYDILEMSFLIPFHWSLRLEGQTHLPHPSLGPFETSMLSLQESSREERRQRTQEANTQQRRRWRGSHELGGKQGEWGPGGWRRHCSMRRESSAMPTWTECNALPPGAWQTGHFVQMQNGVAQECCFSLGRGADNGSDSYGYCGAHRGLFL